MECIRQNCVEGNIISNKGKKKRKYEKGNSKNLSPCSHGDLSKVVKKS